MNLKSLHKCPCGNINLKILDSALYNFVCIKCDKCGLIGRSGENYKEAVIAWESSRLAK